jgi:hypothetical protein
MSGSNLHIEEYLTWYLDPTRNKMPDFAVLITGGWGSGKTTFIRNYLNYKTPLIDHLTEMKTLVIYVSLYGVRNRAEIDERINDEVYPFFKKKGVQLAGKALWNVLKIAAMAKAGKEGIKTVNESGEIAKDVLKILKKGQLQSAAVVFDDVERADMPLPELLGYINEYVEHQHLPCIMIADEKVWQKTCSIKRNSAMIHKYKAEKKELWLEAEFSTDNISLHELESVKEKVIGKTFQIHTNPEQVIEQWLTNESTPLGNRAFKCLKDRKEILLKVFRCAPAQNFRAFKHTLMDFQRFIGSEQNPILENKHLENKEFMDRLLVDFMCIQYWAHLGILCADDVGKTDTLKYFRAARNEENKPESISLWEQLCDRIAIEGLYTQLNTYSRNSWEIFWKEWLDKNWIETVKIRRLINDSIWFDRSNEYWSQMFLQWFQLSDEDGFKAKTELDTALASFTITHPAMILRYFDSLLWYSIKGALDVSPDLILEKFMKYVNDLGDRIEAGKLDVETGITELLCKNEPQEIQFKERLQQALTIAMGAAKENWSREFIKQIESDPMQAAQQLNAFDNQNSFEDADVNAFLDALKKLDNHTNMIIYDSLAARYGMVDACPWLLQERTFLETLKAESKKRFAEHLKPLPPSVFNLFYLIQRIDKGLACLDSMQKRIDEQKEAEGVE